MYNHAEIHDIYDRSNFSSPNPSKPNRIIQITLGLSPTMMKLLIHKASHTNQDRLYLPISKRSCSSCHGQPTITIIQDNARLTYLQIHQLLQLQGCLLRFNNIFCDVIYLRHTDRKFSLGWNDEAREVEKHFVL